jgi:hypothetical protein
VTKGYIIALAQVGVFVACDDFAGSRSSRRRAGPHQSGR